MTARDRTGRFTAERTTTTITERVTVEPAARGPLLPAAEWARLTAPLEHYGVPVILTPAERAKDDDYRDHLKARVHLDRADVRDWHAQARQAVFAPLDDWLGRGNLPQMLA